MEYQFLTIDSHQPHIKKISLNRKERGNALSISLMKELVHVCESLHEDTETRVVIFSGEGKHFCTGADLTDPALAQQRFKARR